MSRCLRLILAVTVSLASFPGEAAAQVVRAAVEINPLGSAARLPGALMAPTPVVGLTLPNASLTPSLSAPAVSMTPTPSALSAAPIVAARAVAVTAEAGVVAAAAAQPAAATRVSVAAIEPAASPILPGAAIAADAANAAALFDGASARSAPSIGEPGAPEEPAAARSPRTREIPRSFSGRLARWTGAAALYAVYRDGVLVQRYASRLNDQTLPPARRASSARLLSSLGRVEAVPALGWASENDASPRVRRAALSALRHIARAVEPKLIRTLKNNPRAGARENAATVLSWIVRHEDSPRAVEALAAAGMVDLSEDARLAAIRSLSLARSPKAQMSLEWMRSQETRPHMRSALDLAVSEARGRRQGLNLHQHRPVSGDLSDARAPLHAVALKRALAVSVFFVVVEFIGGFVTGNMALKADAMHLAADQLIAAAALFSLWIARRPPNSRKSYGYLKVESVMGLLGAVAIGFMGLEMATEAWHHLFEPVAAAVSWSVALFALASLAANLFSALILWRHQGDSLGVKGAFLNAATDAVGSIGVVVSVAAAILFGWAWVQPVVVAVIVALILKTAWGLGKQSWDMLLDAVPPGIDLDRVEADLVALPGAAVVKDLHIWSLNSRTSALTATVLIQPGADHDEVLASAKAMLREKHGISHITVQLETLPSAL